MAQVQIKADSVLVITDKEFGALLTGGNVLIRERVVLLTVRDDATMEERSVMAAKAAEIVSARWSSA